MAGRPSSYKPEYAEQAAKLCNLGATDIELADFFEVDVRTIYRWKNEYDEFCQAIKTAAAEADTRVERSLYARATGYSYPAVKIFQYEGSPVEVPYREHAPPDTTACIFWLKNRKPAEWRDVQRIEHGLADELEKMNAAERDELRKVLRCELARRVGRAGQNGEAGQALPNVPGHGTA